jgi:hypothetical protein
MCVIELSSEELYARNILRELAIKGQTVSYSTFLSLAGLDSRFDLKKSKDRAELGALLGAISRYEYQYGRPMLSSIVYLKGANGKYGEGFFSLAEELYEIDLSSDAKREEFSKEEREYALMFWKRNKKIK